MELGLDRPYGLRARPLRVPQYAGRSAVPFWALIAFTVVLFLAPQNLFPGLAFLRIALLVASLATLAFVFDRLISGDALTVMNREIRILVILFSWALLTVPFSRWPGGSVEMLVGVYFKSLVIFWLLANCVDTPKRLHAVAWTLTLMAIPLAAVAVRNFLTGSSTKDLDEGTVTRIMGYDAPLTENPNDQALMLNLILPISVSLLFSHKGLFARALLLGGIALSIVGVIVTFSRGGFVTLAGLVLVYSWRLFRRRGPGWAMVAVILVFVAIAMLPARYREHLRTVTNIESDRSGSAQSRWADMITASKVILKNPIIGAGIGSDVLAMNEERGAEWIAVHNVYLEYGVDLGVPGLVLFLMVLAGCLKNVRAVQRKTKPVPALREFFYLAGGVEGSLIAFALGAMFHPVAYNFPFYYLAGLSIAATAMFEAGAAKRSL